MQKLNKNLKKEMEMKHFSHDHPLKLVEKKSTDHHDKISFRCCDKSYSSVDQLYGCEICSFFLHESCATLPQQINHPLHPPHSLTLTFVSPSDDKVTCRGCNGLKNNFLAYKCSKCSLFLDVDCAGGNPIIKYDGHEHLLTLLKCVSTDRRHENLTCNECNGPILEDSFFFRCKYNDYRHDYNLHLLCGPLPCTIRDKCHADPLKLMDPFGEDYEDNTGVTYCDACEELRDLKEPVYYCQHCNFIVEIKCVMSEVLSSLEGHHGNVKLDKDGNYGSVFSARCADIAEDDNDIKRLIETEIQHIQEKYSEVELDVSYAGLDFFTIEESVQILKIFQEAGALYSPSETISEMTILETMENTDFSLSKLISSFEISEAQGESDIIPSYSEYSDEAFRNLMEKLDSFYGNSEFLLGIIPILPDYSDFNSDWPDPKFPSMVDMEAEIVGIGELMIMQELASCLKGLLHKHGDFTENSSLEPRVKMFFLNLLCSVITTMSTVQVINFDEKMLQKWWKSLKIVKHAGFEIQFATDRLSKIARALFGMRVRACLYFAKHQLDASCDEVKKLEAKLETKKGELLAWFANTKSEMDESIYEEVMELEAKLEAKKRELEAFKLEQASIKKAMEYETSSIMKECLEHESMLKWKMVWEPSPTMFQKFP